METIDWKIKNGCLDENWLNESESEVIEKLQKADGERRAAKTRKRMKKIVFWANWVLTYRSYDK